MKSKAKGIFMALAMLATSLTASAQEGEIQGYVNIFVRAQVAVEGVGQIWLSADGKGLQTWKTTSDLKRTMPVAYASVFFLANARDNSGTYTFAGWYLDDGDGVFDADKDELISTDEKEAIIAFGAEELTGSDTLYETEAEAKAATQPSEPQALIFALYSKGAQAAPAYRMEYFGETSIDKKVNNPGDVVTITATPIEGYQFEYWKTIKGSTIGKEEKGIVSYDNPYTFTVQGGEKYYAYFSAIDAPVIQFPANGGWKVVDFTKDWVLHEQSDARCYVFTIDDLKNEGGNIYFDFDPEASFDDPNALYLYDAVQRRMTARDQSVATLMYGKGTVRMAFVEQYGHSRANPIIMYNHNPKTPLVVKDPDGADCLHFYRFVENMEGFFEFATTDWMVDPDAPTQVTIPPYTAYMQLSAFELTDPSLGLDIGADIPSIIALSDKAFGPFIEHATDISKVKVSERNLGGMKVYTLSGVKVRATDQPGIYIVDGKKVAIKN